MRKAQRAVKEPLLGVVVALPAEGRAMAGRSGWRNLEGYLTCRHELGGGRQVLWVQGGMGSCRAAAAARWLVKQGATALAVLGVSGGLDPAMGSGDLVLASQVLPLAGRVDQFLPPDWAGRLCRNLAHRKLPVRFGPLLSVARPVLEPLAKSRAFQSCGALAVDMESAAVAEVSREAALPFFALRAVCDPADCRIPPELLGLVDEQGRPQVLRILKTLLRRPLSLREMWRMQRQFRCALTALEQGWRGLQESDCFSYMGDRVHDGCDQGR
jgi:adenosylhomocysteine nucleosidase